VKAAALMVFLAAIAYGGQVTIFEIDFQRYGPPIDPGDIADVQFANYGEALGSGTIDNVSVGVTQPDGAPQSEVPEMGTVWLLAVGTLVGAFTRLTALRSARSPSVSQCPNHVLDPRGALPGGTSSGASAGSGSYGLGVAGGVPSSGSGAGVSGPSEGSTLALASSGVEGRFAGVGSVGEGFSGVAGLAARHSVIGAPHASSGIRQQTTRGTEHVRVTGTLRSTHRGTRIVSCTGTIRHTR